MRNTIVFLLLSAGAVATWLKSRPAPPVTADASAAESGPLGYYLRNAEISATDDSGRVYYRIFAGLLEQASQKDDLVLTEVRVEYDETENVHWIVSAGRGVAPYSREYLDLFDGVQVSTSDDAAMEAVVIETPSLRLDSERHAATTDEAVSITRGGASLSASGFSVDLKEDVIELDHSVKATLRR